MTEQECSAHVRRLKSGGVHGSVMFDAAGALVYCNAPPGVDLDPAFGTPLKLSEALTLIEAGADDDAGVKITKRKRR